MRNQTKKVAYKRYRIEKKRLSRKHRHTATETLQWRQPRILLEDKENGEIIDVKNERVIN